MMWIVTRFNFLRALRGFRRVSPFKSCSFCSIGNQGVEFSSIIQDQRVQRFFDEFEIKSHLDIFEGFQKCLPRSYIQGLLSSRTELKKNVESVKALKNDCSHEKDFIKMADEEEAMYLSDLTNVECQLIRALIPSVDDLVREIFVEITAGVGGKATMLFSKILFDMYQGCSEFKGWEAHLAALETTYIGGVRQATIFISGGQVYSVMMHESGVHRVQRVPSTEKGGRIHTSTATVAVFPQPSDIDVVIHEKDLIVDTMRSNGAGGQHVNTTDSAVRITHVPSGTAVECQTDRSQIQNGKLALKRLRAKLYEKQQQLILDDIKKTRKQQVGTSARSDKVRTYTFLQDRVTDHRLMESCHNISQFIEGGELLGNIIVKLVSTANKERVINLVSQLGQLGS